MISIASVDLVSLADNHALDANIGCLRDTLAILDQARSLAQVITTHFPSPLPSYCAPVTLQIVLPTSSTTRSAPDASNATPTGRPIASPFSLINPFRTST